MSNKNKNEIDMEYTWGDVPPLHAGEIYAAYSAKADPQPLTPPLYPNVSGIAEMFREQTARADFADALHARIAELERDNANQSKLLDVLRQTIDGYENEVSQLQYDAGVLRRELDAANERAEQAEMDARALLQWLMCARADLMDWGNYAPDYFKEKHGLDEDLAKYQRIIDEYGLKYLNRA